MPRRAGHHAVDEPVSRVPGAWALLALLGYLGVSLLFFVAGPAATLRELNIPAPPDQTPAWSAQELSRYLDAVYFASMPEGGVAVFERYLWWDYLYAAVTAFAALVLVAWATHQKSLFALLPLALAVTYLAFEFMENSVMLWAASEHPQPVRTGLAGWLTTIKLGCFTAIIVTIIAGIVVRLWNRR